MSNTDERTQACAGDDPIAVTRYARPDSAPRSGLIAPFDAGWNARELGFARATVAALSPDRAWALLGWDTCDLVARREAA